MSGFRVGLTGGLAAGKSTVSRRLSAAGFQVVDSDQLVAQLYAPEAEGTRRVVLLFGTPMLAEDGSVDHRKLATKVFQDRSARERLEAEIHPLVERRFAALVEGSQEIAVLEATLLVEAGMSTAFDLVVTVEADPEIRLQRAIERGLTEDDARNRLEAQSQEPVRLRAAHRVLRNDGDLASLERRVDRLVEDLQLMAQGGRDTLDLLADAVLVTGNAGKLREARRICSVDLTAVDVDLPEIQSLDVFEVLRAKGLEALRRIGGPVIVEETSLELASMDGFPGPLVKWMLQAVGAEGIARAAAAFGEPGATARCVLMYLDPERELVAEGTTEGTLRPGLQGDGGFGWDPAFVPAPGTETYAEMSADRKDSIGHRGRAWRNFLMKLGH